MIFPIDCETGIRFLDSEKLTYFRPAVWWCRDAAQNPPLYLSPGLILVAHALIRPLGPRPWPQRAWYLDSRTSFLDGIDKSGGLLVDPASIVPKNPITRPPSFIDTGSHRVSRKQHQDKMRCVGDYWRGWARNTGFELGTFEPNHWVPEFGL